MYVVIVEDLIKIQSFIQIGNNSDLIFFRLIKYHR